MKAREIKKLVEKEYRGRIKEYKGIIEANKVRVTRVKSQIEELDFLREMLFDITEPYTFDDKEPEVDDVQF